MLLDRRLRAIIREARRYNAVVSFHDNQSQADVVWSGFKWNMAARDSLGRPFGGGVWGGVQLVQTSMPACLPMFKRFIPRIIRAYGIRETYHLDTIGMQWICDTHPRRRYNATQCHAADFELLREYNRHGIDVTGEILVDPYVGKLGHVWALFNYGTWWQGEERVPFANFVYQGVTSWNAGHAEIALTYFADRPSTADTILGMLLDGGGVGLTLRGGRWPDAREHGHDADWESLVDLLSLVQPVYHLLRDRKWKHYRQHGTVRRVDYGPGSHIEVDPAKPGYQVVVEGQLIARDFTTVFPGPRKGTLLAFSRQDCELDWPAPRGWKEGVVRGTTLTASGPGVRVAARLRNGRLRLALRAHQPVRIEPAK